MIVKMLEAVSEMLADNKEVKVTCAKTILDKVIEGMKSSFKDLDSALYLWDGKHRKVPITATEVSIVEDVPKDKLIREYKERIKPPADGVEVIADAGIIKGIKGADNDTYFMVDGKKMHWTEMIGVSFTEITRI